jgi:hypothetical protein
MRRNEAMVKRCSGFASVLTLCMAALLIGGCGSSGNKEGDGGLTNVGDTVCVQCHSAVQDPLTRETIITQYERSSPHKDVAAVNGGNGCESCHGSASQHNGVGPIQYPDPFAGNGTRCADCHNGVIAPATDAPTTFAGSLHANMTIETGNACRRCHTHEGAVLGNIGGLTGNGEIMDNAVNQGFVPYSPAYSQFNCATCHEHGAGLRTVMARDNNSNLVNWNPDKNQTAGQFDLCTSCHTMYDYTGNTLLASGTGADAATGKPATVKVGHHETSWYRVIATTHYDNPVTGLKATDVALDNGNIIEGYVIRNVIYDAAAGETVIHQNPCFDCHGHEAYAGTYRGRTTTPTIYTDWAQSGHAGGLLKAKYAAADNTTSRTTNQVDSVMISGVAAADCVATFGSLKRATSAGDAWAHYQWERTLKADGTNDRGSCQKCHTATGASNYLSNPAAYDYKANDFSHLSGWAKATSTTATVPSPQQELLYCWGCHTSAAKGLLRAPGAITADYNFNGARAVFPNVGNSNICISCHSGQASGESVTAIADSSFTNVSFVNSHYLAVAGLMYVKSGFIAWFGTSDNSIAGGATTYRQSLTSDADGGTLTSTHRKLGTTAINGDSHNTAVFTAGNFDSNGPCVTCHMQATGQATRSTSHTWEINMNAANEVCIKCHSGEVDNAALLEEFIDGQAAPFQNALAVALDRLGTRYNITYNPASYPYFFDNLIGTAVKDWTRVGSTAGTLSTADAKKLMGACFNINLLIREPAAYVHARTYARRLLYDTIDFLDDGTINMSTSATAVAVDPTNYVRGALATSSDTTESYKYLTGYSRTTGAWNAIPRP